MVATVVVSGAYRVDDTAGIDAFLTANLGGAAGDVVSVIPVANGQQCFIICSKA